MKLERNEAELFYSLWFPLMNFTNERYLIHPEINKIAAGKGVPFLAAKDIANYIWKHTEIIDEYLAEVEMPDEHRQIINGWKRHRTGHYILERNLKKGTIFISMEDTSVYSVFGLYSTFEEMFSGRTLPIVLEATLIPFRGKIVTDGVVSPYRVSLGPEYKLEFRSIYMNAKRNKEIQVSV